MHVLRRDKKEEEDVGGNPFGNLEKSSVLQETRIFNETPINPRKCGHILTKLLYLINQGESIGSTEATEAFFAMTKLFQSKDTTLRRLMYLGIKEMSKIADDVIIVTSSLMKDMTGKEDQFRGPAIRALCSITDTSMLQNIERYMKQAIVDKVSAVSSAALVSSLHLGRGGHDITKRWVNEAQEAVNSDNVMVQYHALGLLYHIRKNDKLAVTKLVSKFSKHTLKSPYAYCLLIRIASKLIEEEDAGSESPMFDFIESCLRHKVEMVIYEAAHAIVNMKNTTAKDLAPAVSVLQLFCSSPKPTLRFAAVRTLNKVAMKHPAAVTACNLDLENLITDVNRSIATLAITTLLKTGNESSVDRLMKQISSFMSEISDEFKIVVVQAIRSLCAKFPRKHSVLMNFLSSMLREELGTTYTLVCLPAEPTLVTGTFTCSLKFVVKDCDPNTGEPDDEGYDDEYVLEDVDVAVADHVQRVIKPNFAASWEEVGPDNELEDTYALSTMNSLEEAIKNIIQYLGMQPCERSDKLPEGKSSHTLFLAGVFRGGHDALVRAKLALTDSGVTMQLTVRSTDPYVSEVLATAIA
ncbi:LOW QUALITY PROTEIN: coatomer subunit gamma-2-like [Gigantopelta aegis]|uniref:LOW QUALITY PROTEIN: coatomer subunit gamma-2-like n=1 Tax=Gigantopelta aegis TaxID=1735272 RepID=UPI001B88A5EA|nr:LOW QUALITY PROTEIN: coatomer subunit gamma-2-like [Gigantopelta aegis]